MYWYSTTYWSHFLLFIVEACSFLMIKFLFNLLLFLPTHKIIYRCSSHQNKFFILLICDVIKCFAISVTMQLVAVGSMIYHRFSPQCYLNSIQNAKRIIVYITGRRNYICRCVIMQIVSPSVTVNSENCMGNGDSDMVCSSLIISNSFKSIINC